VELVEFVLLLALTGIAAGLVGSLTGLGGAVVVIPVLAVAFAVPFPLAAGTGLLTVLATSSTTGAAYVRDGLTDLRIGMFLEIATVPGALLGATATVFLVRRSLDDALLVALGGVLLLILLATAWSARTSRATSGPPDAVSRRLGLSGSYHDAAEERTVAYAAQRTDGALGIAFAAGLVSGMFGIGGGVFKVHALERYGGLPMKVATATSNLMIGITAAAGSGVLLAAGYINPYIAAPAALGTALGAYLGTTLLPGLRNQTVRLLFLPVVAGLAIEVILRGLGYA
jgi:uncharacterized protein